MADNTLKIVIEDDGLPAGGPSAYAPPSPAAAPAPSPGPTPTSSTSTPNLNAAVEETVRRQQAGPVPTYNAPPPVVTPGGATDWSGMGFGPHHRTEEEFKSPKQDAQVSAFYDEQFRAIREQRADNELFHRERMAQLRRDEIELGRIAAERKAREAERTGKDSGRLEAERVRTDSDAKANDARAKKEQEQAAFSGLTDKLNFATAEVSTFGRGLGQFAKNNPLGAVNAASDAASMALGMIPGVGKAASAGLKLFTSGINAANEIVQAQIERGKELARFNGDLARANAEANARRIEADIREAERTGKSIAKLTESEARLSASVQNMGNGFKDGLGKITGAGTELAANIAEAIEPAVNDIGEFFSGFVESFIGPITLINKGFDEFRADEKAKKSDAKLNSIAQGWFDAIDKMSLGAPPLDPAYDAARAGLEVPILDTGRDRR